MGKVGIEEQKMATEEIQAEPLIHHPESTTSKLDEYVLDPPATTDDMERGKNEVGWGAMIANFLKILIFGACVFWYDMTSKFLFKSTTFKSKYVKGK